MYTSKKEVGTQVPSLFGTSYEFFYLNFTTDRNPLEKKNPGNKDSEVGRIVSVLIYDLCIRTTAYKQEPSRQLSYSPSTAIALCSISLRYGLISSMTKESA